MTEISITENSDWSISVLTFRSLCSCVHRFNVTKVLTMYCQIYAGISKDHERNIFSDSIGPKDYL